jgi:hypothetical protein
MKSIKLWMRVVPFVFFALVTLAPERAWAGCEYATADSYASWNSDDSYIYTSVVTEGQVICSYNGMQHTYYAYNSLNGNSAWWESEGPTANYVSLENDQEIPISNGETIDWDYGSEVYCPMMGFFYVAEGNSTIKSVITNYDYTGETVVIPFVTKACQYTQACHGGSTATCPLPPALSKSYPIISVCPAAYKRVNLTENGVCTGKGTDPDTPQNYAVPCT